MPKKPLRSAIKTQLDKFGIPSEAKLQQPLAVSATISRIIADDESITAFHHKMVHYGICFRYGFALAVAADKKMFAAYVRDKRIIALARQPKNESNVLVSLFNATYADPKKASKYYKRIETLWAKRSSVKEVSNFLRARGLSEPVRKALPPPLPASEPSLDSEGTDERTETDGSVERKSSNTPRSIATKDPPGGSIIGWPRNAKVGRKYRLTVKIYSYDGETAIFELVDIPELST